MTAKLDPFLSYSVNNEDVILNRLFGTKAQGFFVDVGAAHPLFENDTRALYDRGWRGINIEPTAEFYCELAAQRPRDVNLNLAVSDEPGELVFYEVVGTGLSTGNRDDAERAAAKGFEVIRRTVPTVTLSKILKDADAPEIDLLKVDVEGFELKVLQSNDWDRFRPRIILAEGTFPESPVRRPDGVLEYLAGQGYRHVYFDGLNDFYTEQSFIVPPEAFDRPPNVFDNFVPFREHELARANVGLAEQIASLEKERANADSYIYSLNTELTRRNAAISALSEAAEATAVDLNRARAELIVMRERRQALAAELDDATMRLDEATMRLDAAVMRQMDAEQKTERMVQQLGSVYASSSWRITRPLRALARPRRTLGLVLARLKQ